MFNHQIMALYIHLCSSSLVWGWITITIYTIWGQKTKPRAAHSECEFSDRSQWESWLNFRHSGKWTIHVRLHLHSLSSQIEPPLLGSHSRSCVETHTSLLVDLTMWRRLSLEVFRSLKHMSAYAVIAFFL